MQEVQLYIGTERVEFFDDETISLTETIQNVRDIEKVFTDFSKQFSVPASRTNNKIFKHYYNYDISNGFDARFRVDATLKLNGADYRKGTIRLNSVSLKDNKPDIYKIVFFGETITLNDVLGEDELDSLPLSIYDHPYTQALAHSGFTVGLEYNGSTMVEGTDRDIIYPLISHSDRLIYDSSAAGTLLEDTTNLYTTGGGTEGINYTQLKPALKLKNIVDAIVSKYPEITFSDDFFNTTKFTELYMLLHREKGGVYAGIGEVSKTIGLDDWLLSSGDDNKTNPLVSYWNHALDTAFWNIEFSIATTETGTYNVSIVDRTTGTTLSENVGLTGNNTILFDITASPATPLISYNLDLVVSTTDSANFSTFTPTVEFERTEFDGDEIEIVTTGNYQTSPALQSIIGTIEISMQIPKMRVIDFLTSIFKQFNLTAYVEDGVIIVKTLDSYYADGGEHDITPYVDVTDSQVGRAMLYKNIEFKYPDPKTFLTIQKMKGIILSLEI